MHVIELPLESGGSVCFEVAEAPGYGKTYRGGTTGTVDQLSVTFESVLGKLRPVIEAVTGSLTGLSAAPESVEIEFSVTLTADAGIIIAKAGSEASLSIKLGWKPRDAH